MKTLLSPASRTVLFALLALLLIVATACTTPTPTPVPPTVAPTAPVAPKATDAPKPTEAPKATSAPATAVPATVAPVATKAAAIEPDVEFFKGKNLTFIVATKPGGGYDTYARTVAKYVQKNLPGSTVVIKNVPGAGHIIGANELYAAKADGLTIGTFNTALIFGQIIGQEGIQFDLAKYSWITKMSSDNRVVMVGAKTPYKTFDDLLKASQAKPVLFATNGPTSAAHVDALLVQESTGLKVKTVPGYQGKDGDLAILRGEVEAEVGSYGSLKSLVDSGDARFLLQIGKEKIAALKDVPLITEVVKKDKVGMSDLLVANASLGRLVAAPPDLPPARRAALLQAFQKALVDPDFLADAKKADLEIDPAFGDDVTKLVKGALTQQPTDLALLKDILGPAAQAN